jgi:hypothetical protein
VFGEFVGKEEERAEEGDNERHHEHGGSDYPPIGVIADFERGYRFEQASMIPIQSFQKKTIIAMRVPMMA